MVSEKTTILINKTTVLELKKLQDSISETYNDVILKLIEFYKKNKKEVDKK